MNTPCSSDFADAANKVMIILNICKEDKKKISERYRLIKEAAGRFERITNHVTLKYGRNKTKLITVVKIAHLYLMFGTARNLNLFAVNGRQYAGHVFVESY